MEVDTSTSVNLSLNTTIDNSVNFSAIGLAASIHAPNKFN